jgi:hypothetical protein
MQSISKVEDPYELVMARLIRSFMDHLELPVLLALNHD